MPRLPILKSVGLTDSIFADTMRTSLTFPPLLPSFLKSWSKLVAIAVTDCSSPVLEAIGIVTVVVYGNVDFTIDCIMAQLLKSSTMASENNDFITLGITLTS